MKSIIQYSQSKFQKVFLLAFTVVMIMTLSACTSASVDNVDLPKGSGPISSTEGSKQVLANISQLAIEQHDKYAAYYSKDDYDALFDSIVGTYSGIGVYIFQDAPSSPVTIVGVMKNGPAYKAGLKTNDQIVNVNGESVVGKSSDEVSVKLRGMKIGSVISLVVNRPNEGEKTFNIKIEDVDIPTVESKIFQDHGNIGLIKIYNFSMSTGEQFVAELQDLMDQGITGLIVDLRDNGGGELNSALQICDVFVEKGQPLMYVTNSTGTFSYEAATEKIGLPVLAMQNGQSASASEVVLGAIKDSGAGKTLGETSYGKGLVQDVHRLQSGAGLKSTVSKYTTAGDNDIHEVGIEPDYEFSWSEDVDSVMRSTLDAEYDPQLAEALRILQEGIK